MQVCTHTHHNPREKRNEIYSSRVYSDTEIAGLMHPDPLAVLRGSLFASLLACRPVRDTVRMATSVLPNHVPVSVSPEASIIVRNKALRVSHSSISS